MAGAAFNNVGLVQSSDPRDSDRKRDYIAEFPATPEFQPDRTCERRQLRMTLDRAIGTLPERYRKAVFLYYTNDLTMKEIGDMLASMKATSRRS